MTKTIKNPQKNGFTLVEMLVYVAILSSVLVSLVYFTWDVLYGRVRVSVAQEVSQNARLISKRLLFEIKNAQGINAVTSNSLCLEMSDSSRNPTYFHVVEDRLFIGWGGGSTDCSSLTQDVALMSNRVVIENLDFTDLSSGTESLHVRFNFTISSTSEITDYQASESYSGSAELRSH